MLMFRTIVDTLPPPCGDVIDLQANEVAPYPWDKV